MPAVQTEPDRNRTIASLAAQFQAPVDAVAALYEDERAGLAADANVTQFLHIFAARRVEDVLRKRAPAQAATTADSRTAHAA